MRYVEKVNLLADEIKKSIKDIVVKKRMINIPYFYDDDFEHGV